MPLPLSFFYFFALAALLILAAGSVAMYKRGGRPIIGNVLLVIGLSGVSLIFIWAYQGSSAPNNRLSGSVLCALAFIFIVGGVITMNVRRARAKK